MHSVSIPFMFGCHLLTVSARHSSYDSCLALRYQPQYPLNITMTRLLCIIPLCKFETQSPQDGEPPSLMSEVRVMSARRPVWTLETQAGAES